MTYPMQDFVIHEGGLYRSHLRDMVKGAWWLPSAKSQVIARGKGLI